MKFVITLCLLISPLVNAGTLYQCKIFNGDTSFQDKPCEEITVSTSQPKKGKFNNDEFKEAMIKILAKMTGKTESELIDPKIRQAAEALAATDAGKSYAFTKIYGVSANHCGPDVKKDLQNYKKKASDIIALGQYYYTNGIHIRIGGKSISKSGSELTKGLDGMIKKLEKEHKTLSKGMLQKKCNEASQALKSLAMVYGS